jgi:hypothetical protein
MFRSPPPLPPLPSFDASAEVEVRAVTLPEPTLDEEHEVLVTGAQVTTPMLPDWAVYVSPVAAPRYPIGTDVHVTSI